MSEHYPELFDAIEAIDSYGVKAENQTWHIKRTELRIQLEIAEQLRRIADWLKDGAVQVVTNGGDE